MKYFIILIILIGLMIYLIGWTNLTSSTSEYELSIIKHRTPWEIHSGYIEKLKTKYRR